MTWKRSRSERYSFTRRKALRSIGIIGAGSCALSGIATAESKGKNSKELKEDESDLPVPEAEIVYPDEMKSSNPFAEQVSIDQLPLSSEYVGGTGADGGVSTTASSGCYGTGVEFLDVEVCFNDDGSLSVSVGALGLIADSLVVSPGQASRNGHVTTSMPGLPGVIQEFTTGWTLRWSGLNVDSLRVEASLRAWDFGIGWYHVTSFDTYLIS